MEACIRAGHHGLRTFALMEEIVGSEEADFVSFNRPLIREPGLIQEWQKGNRRRAACISCNFCLEELCRLGMTNWKFNGQGQSSLDPK